MRITPFSDASRTLVLSAALAGGLSLGAGLAADQGPRHHAAGRYEAATATYEVADGDDLAAIAPRSSPAAAASRSA